MLETLLQYGLFLAETVTLVAGILIVFGGIIAISRRAREKLEHGELEIRKINDKFDSMRHLLSESILPKALFKKFKKDEKEKEKLHKDAPPVKRLFVLDFDGDIKASAVDTLREEITAILTVATPEDEVLIRLESAGGMVHAYGLAAAQLDRLKHHNIPITVSVDKVAASGGYMMAVVAHKILAAPFAMIGSIGVIAQIPNFNKVLKKHDVDFEQLSAGEYKRTLTLFGENTEKGRQKMQEEIEEVHDFFKKFVTEHRSSLNITEVATGEHWVGKKAKELGLVDEIITSDDYLLNAATQKEIFEVTYHMKETLGDKIGSLITGAVRKVVKI